MYQFLFGPVPSRRLGMSLGIDLVPKKVCTLNCVYCEVGKTTTLTTQRKEYVSCDKVIDELDRFMIKGPRLDYITFSGCGEPTLNSRIGDVLKYVQRKYPGIRTAVLTNGTLLHDPAVRKEINTATVLLPSLDAASDKVFRRINRPKSSLDIASYIQGLIDLREEYSGEIWLEIFLLKGFNDTVGELELLRKAILEIHPDRVQLNTLDRPGIVSGLLPLSLNDMERIIKDWQMDNVEIIASSTARRALEAYDGDVETKILETITRRPCTLDDLQEVLALNRNEINKYLSVLENEDRITSIILERGVFYEIKNK